MQSPVKSLGYIKHYSLSIPRLIKSLAILSETTAKRSATDEKNRNDTGNQKKGHISQVGQLAYYFYSVLISASFSKVLLTNH